jgi:hypothetical protein
VCCDAPCSRGLAWQGQAPGQRAARAWEGGGVGARPGGRRASPNVPAGVHEGRATNLLGILQLPTWSTQTPWNLVGGTYRLSTCSVPPPATLAREQQLAHHPLPVPPYRLPWENLRVAPRMEVCLEVWIHHPPGSRTW